MGAAAIGPVGRAAMRPGAGRGIVGGERAGTAIRTVDGSAARIGAGRGIVGRAGPCGPIRSSTARRAPRCRSPCCRRRRRHTSKGRGTPGSRRRRRVAPSRVLPYPSRLCRRRRLERRPAPGHAAGAGGMGPRGPARPPFRDRRLCARRFHLRSYGGAGAFSACPSEPAPCSGGRHGPCAAAPMPPPTTRAPASAPPPSSTKTPMVAGDRGARCSGRRDRWNTASASNQRSSAGTLPVNRTQGAHPPEHGTRSRSRCQFRLCA